MIKLHENDNNDSDFKHVCIITVFLLIKLLYLFIYSLNYLFRSIQTLTVLTDLIDLIAVPSLITCCLLNLSSKSTPSQQKFTFTFILKYLSKVKLIHTKFHSLKKSRIIFNFRFKNDF